MDTTRLSPNFTLAEMTRSNTAAQYGIANVPNAAQVENLRMLCERTLEPLRAALRAKYGDHVVINVTSGFRSTRLNKHKDIGGARSSQHQTGRAADINATGLTAAELFQFIVESDLVFDQVIEEFGRWVHVSYTPNPRRSMLIARRNEKDEVKYTKYIKNE